MRRSARRGSRSLGPRRGSELRQPLTLRDVVGLLLQRPLVLVVAIVCLGVAIGAASYALTRSGARRLVAAVVAILALAAPLALVVAYGRLLQLLLLIALVAVAAVATRHALGRDLKSLRSGPPLAPLWDPRSGRCCS
jgi:hypothetical protein